MENQIRALFPNPPVSYQPISPQPHLFIWNYINSLKTTILIGFIFIIVILAALFIPMKIFLSKPKNEKPSGQQDFHNKHDIPTEIKNTNYPTITSNCNIPVYNATWEKQGTIFVNLPGDCGSNDTQLCRPFDLFIDNIHDNLYVVDTKNNRIQKYSLTASLVNGQSAKGITVASQNLIEPSSIFVDTLTEDMYILDYTAKESNSLGTNNLGYRVHLWPKNDDIGRILFEHFPQDDSGYSSYMVLDEYMNIYIDTRYYVKKWFASSNYTQVITVAGNIASEAKRPDELSFPRGLYIDDDLTLYIVDWNNHRIQKWLANARQGTTIVSGLFYAYGITLDCNKNIYYSDFDMQAVYQLNIITNEKTTVIGKDQFPLNERQRSISNPYAMKFDKFGNMFVIDGWLSRIKKFSLL